MVLLGAGRGDWAVNPLGGRHNIFMSIFSSFIRAVVLMTGGFHFQIYFGKIKIYERDVKLILTSFLFTIKPDITVGDDGFYMDYMREDFKLRNSGKILCIASLLGLLVLSGCGLKSEPAAGTGADGAAVEAEGTESAGADEAGRMRIRRTVTGRTRRFIFIPHPGRGFCR